MTHDEAKAVILAYKELSAAPAWLRVMKDLKRFCRAERSCFDADARIHAVAEGRREVWLRIERFINVSLDELLPPSTIHIRDEDEE